MATRLLSMTLVTPRTWKNNRSKYYYVFIVERVHLRTFSAFCLVECPKVRTFAPTYAKSIMTGGVSTGHNLWVNGTVRCWFWSVELRSCALKPEKFHRTNKDEDINGSRACVDWLYLYLFVQVFSGPQSRDVEQRFHASAMYIAPNTLLEETRGSGQVRLVFSQVSINLSIPVHRECGVSLRAIMIISTQKVPSV